MLVCWLWERLYWEGQCWWLRSHIHCLPDISCLWLSGNPTLLWPMPLNFPETNKQTNKPTPIVSRVYSKQILASQSMNDQVFVSKDGCYDLPQVMDGSVGRSIRVTCLSCQKSTDKQNSWHWEQLEVLEPKRLRSRAFDAKARIRWTFQHQKSTWTFIHLPTPPRFQQTRHLSSILVRAISSPVSNHWCRSLLKHPGGYRQKWHFTQPSGHLSVQPNWQRISAVTSAWH
jgi:hypothetical protein